MRETETHIYFLKNYLSNWYKSPFHFKTLTKPIIVGKLLLFDCGEQYMMWRKAVLFEDFEIATKILMSSNPKEQKTLGRQVRNYNDKIWADQRFDIMVEGLSCKFRENKLIRNKLILTGKKILVEANPYDTIWGVGLSEDDDAILDEKNWRGQNLLGKVLMKVRENASWDTSC